jgi:TP901 family phage tail tape measure protein
MNAYMNIQVRVLSANAAAQIRALQGQINGLSMAMAGANRVGFLGGGQRQISALSKFGNQLQWTGRQLQYNFTLPLALAGGAAMKFALDNETAFTRISKVYGDAAMSADVMKNELNALKKAFVALSNEYGVQQSEVLNIAADWAAAGASGLALARGVEQTLRVMVLGEMNAADATSALISIQAQYNLSSAQLIDTIAKLNIVENQTAISMQGLIQGFQRSAGVARSAGVDVDHLAAMLAALVPAAGSAAQAGNALKTILSRIMSPTKKAADTMEAMGINVKSLAWNSLNGSQRLEVLAQKFHGLADSQKTAVATTIASQYQLNKFEILMDSIFKASDKATRGQSRYAQALDATKNRAYYLNQAQKELNQVLNSNPQRLKQIWVILQNAMADVIQPMIPLLLGMARVIADLVQAFNNLPLPVKQTIMYLLLFLALFGPLIRYIGSTMTLIGELGWFFAGLAKQVLFVVKVFAGFLALPFSALGSVFGALSGGILRFGGALLAAARAVGAFILTGPLFGQFFGVVGAILSRGGGIIVAIWMTALGRMAAVTGPMLAAIQGLFALWQLGMIRVITLVRNAMLAGWLSMTASARFVGPAIIASFRTMWTMLVAITTVGVTSIVARMRAMVALTVAMFANWRVILVRLSTLMWTGILTVFRGGIVALGRYLLAGLTALAGPWGIAIAAILAVLYMFRDQIGQLVRNIINFFRNMPPGIANAFKPLVNLFNTAVKYIITAFNALPKGVRDAMMAVVHIVAEAARQVYQLFSYLNPFAHHSPSLVENVTNGMAIVKAQFKSITDIEGPIKSAYEEIKKFGAATASLMKGMDSAKRASDRADLAKVAPGALDEFDALVRRIQMLTPILNQLKAAVDAQQAVVDKWKSKLDAANNALDVQQKKLDALNKVLQTAKDNLQQAQDNLQKYANTPITGMKAMEDQIFANEMAQKKLRLEIMKMEDAGQSVDDLTNKMQALHGMQELLTGERKSLQDAGAGSEILKTYDDQIASIKDQTKGVAGQITEYQKLSDELDKLQRQGEELDLEKSLKFDELTKQINDAANATKEMSFDDIMKGINDSNAAIDKYGDEVDKATKAVEEQQKAVDAATAARDAIQASYDAEVKKLDQLKDAYDKVNQTIQDINSSLNDMASAAADAIQRAKDAAGKGKGALGPAGDFPDVGGAGSLGREGGLGDQSSLIDQFTKDLAKKTGDLMGGLDLFGGIKKKFSALQGWFKANVGPVFGAIGDAAKQIFGGIDWLAPFRKIDWSFMKEIWDTIKDIWNTGVGWIMSIVRLFADDVKKIWQTIWDKLKTAFSTLAPEIAKFKDLLKPMADLFKEIWTIVKPLAAILGVILLGAIKILTSILANVLGPVLDFIIGVLKGLIEILHGILQFILGVFTGNWKLAWEGIKNIFKGVWDVIWSILKGAVSIIWGIIKGFVEGIVDFFKWLYDELVGHSIIPDMVNAIIAWIASLPGKAWAALKDLGAKILDIVHKAWDMWVAANKAAWNLINTWFHGIPQAVWNALVDLANKLRSKATEGMNAFWNGAKAIWNAVSGWFKGWAGNIGGWIANVAGTLYNIAHNAITNFKNGANAAWGAVTSFFSGWYTRIKNAIGNVSLYNIGKSILNSLLDGLKAAWNDTKNFLSGLGQQIKNLKGPIEKDRKLLIPEGEAIMGSLHEGLVGEWSAVEAYLRTVAPSIAQAISSGIPASLPVGLQGNATAGLGGTLATAAGNIATMAANNGSTSGNQYGTTNNYTFTGDLSFPNVTDGGDAEEFLANLEAIVRGG